MDLLGIDIGTTGCKVVLYSQNGVSKGQAYREYAAVMSPEQIELDPELIFSGVLDCISEIGSYINLKNVVAASVSAMTDTVTAVGADGKALLPSIVSFDPRGDEEAEMLRDRFGEDWIFRHTGMEMHSSHTLCKILWMRRNLPKLVEKTWKFLCYEEYILYRLGAEPVSSYTTASKTACFDVHQLCWIPELLNFCGICSEQLPRTAASGVQVGNISPAIAERTGLPSTVVLVTGGFDQACCGLGAGIYQPGNMLDTTGTNEILFFTMEDKPNPQLLMHGMNYSQHVVPDIYSSYAQILNAGGAFRWCRDTMFCDMLVNNTLDIYKRMTDGMETFPGRIQFLPFLSGVGTPDKNSHIKGSFMGVALCSSRFQLAQAVLEGITYEMRYNIDLVGSLIDHSIETLFCVGGAAKSDYWLQLKSNISQLETTSIQGLEAGACGAAMLAGIGCGLFANSAEAVDAFCRKRVLKTFIPDAEAVKRYEEAYQRYLAARRLYMENADVFSTTF